MTQHIDAPCTTSAGVLLVAMAAEPLRLRWIQSWMIVGVVTTSLGLVALSRAPPILAPVFPLAMGIVLTVTTLFQRIGIHPLDVWLTPPAA